MTSDQLNKLELVVLSIIGIPVLVFVIRVVIFLTSPGTGVNGFPQINPFSF